MLGYVRLGLIWLGLVSLGIKGPFLVEWQKKKLVRLFHI